MNILKNLIKTKIATITLTLLLIASAFFIFTSSSDTTVNAAVPSNMLQYEWSSAKGSDPAATCFSDGPGPMSPNIKWRTQIPGVTGNAIAFNGLVFAQTNTETYALDGGTGEIVWQRQGAGSIGKLDNTYMLIGRTCVKIADGTTVWTGPAGFSYSQTKMYGVPYIPELKMYSDGNRGWDLSDPSQPPTLVWDRTDENIWGAMYANAYGDGKLFCGTYDFYIVCVDMLTGETVWAVPTTGGAGLYGGSYIDGKFIWGALDNNMHAWDADTGELLWTYNPGTWYGMWACASGAAYGMIYEKNQDTYLYAIDADTGEMVWRAKGPGIGYSNTVVIADGKIYSQMGENQYRDFATGEYAYAEYSCYDAYTGEMIWTMPLENAIPLETAAIAYGNLYILPTTPTPKEEGVWTYYFRGEGSLGEVWCISGETTDWPMYLSGPEHEAWGAGPTYLALDWTVELDAPITSSMATIVDGIAYIGDHAGTIYALNADTGSRLWTFKTDHWVKSTVAVVNGKLYTGTDDGNVYCLNAATGAKLWETYTGGLLMNNVGGTAILGSENTRSSPIVLNGRVYVGAMDGNLYCLDANTGTEIWKFQAGGQIFATPTIVDDAIYIPASTPIPDGTLYKLDLNGNVIWQMTVPYNLDKTPGSGSYMLASATVADGMVFLRQPMRLNYGINATTGDIMWTYDARYNPGTPFQLGGVHQYMPMLYKYGRLYFNDFYGITCMNATDGTEIWHTYLSRENLAQSLTYSYERIYTVTEYGVLFVLDALYGEKLSYHEFAPSRSQLHSSPIPYNGKLYVGSSDFNFYCFGEARLMASASDAASASISSEQIWSNPTETTETAYITSEVAIIAAIAVACIIGLASFWALRKRK